MKKCLKSLALVMAILLMTGCGADKETVKKCTLVSNNAAQGYKLESEYNVYSKGDVVSKVVTKEVVTSDNESILTYFEDYLTQTYNATNETYGGYTNKVTNEDGKVVSETTIDYNKMDLEQYVKDNSVMKSYVNSDNELLTEGVIKVYEQLGATCE